MKKHLPTELDERNYQKRVAQKLKDYSKRVLGSVPSKVSDSDWEDWIGDLGKAVDIERSTVFDFKAETINDLNNKRAAKIRPYAVHLRMHRHLHESELTFARELDIEVFGCPIDRVFAGPLFQYEIDEEEYPDGVNFAPGLARLTEVDWEQMPRDSDERELSARLFMDSVREIHGHRDLRYGLREVWFRIRPENFEITKYYERGANGMPDYVRYLDNGNWTLSAPKAPTDWLDALSGSVVACPICIGLPTTDTGSQLHFEVYARRNSPQLKSVDPITGDEETLEQKVKRNLIEKIFAIYISKLNGISGSDEFVLLSSKSISP